MRLLDFHPLRFYKQDIEYLRIQPKYNLRILLQFYQLTELTRSDTCRYFKHTVNCHMTFLPLCSLCFFSYWVNLIILHPLFWFSWHRMSFHWTWKTESLESLQNRLHGHLHSCRILVCQFHYIRLQHPDFGNINMLLLFAWNLIWEKNTMVELPPKFR